MKKDTTIDGIMRHDVRHDTIIKTFMQRALKNSRI